MHGQQNIRIDFCLSSNNHGSVWEKKGILYHHFTANGFFFVVNIGVGKIKKKELTFWCKINEKER